VIPERSTARTLADVQRIVSRLTGRSIDNARVQVIRTAPIPGSARRKLTSLSFDRSSEAFSVRAALELSGDILMGESASPQGTMFERRAISEAIVKGTTELIDFPIAVQRVYIISDVENQIAVVILARRDEILVGSAVVRQGEHDAIARATLDALNRFAAPTVDEIRS
jgi:hypothetical protein